MKTEYKLVSGDGHVNEPPDLWLKRLPKKFKARSPKMATLKEGSAWMFENASGPINFGNNVQIPVEKRATSGTSSWCRWEDVSPGGYDSKARIKEQDKDGVDAEIVYPTPRPSGAVWTTPEREFQLAMIHAYNDWLSEFCGYAPDRLMGSAMIPATGIDDALAEAKRAMALPGMKAVLLGGGYPNGKGVMSDEDDRFWRWCVENDVPVNVHVSLTSGPPGPAQASMAGNGKPLVGIGALRDRDAKQRMYEFISYGVFDRFPELKVVWAEVDCGWIPHAKEQMDDRYRRANPALQRTIKEKPSYYFDKNIYSTYITDRFAVINRAYIGINQMLWSSDYPHVGADFPHSWRTIDGDFVGVPNSDKHAILAGNACKLYKLGEYATNAKPKAKAKVAARA